MTGFMKHTFQVGFDWKESNVTTTSYDATKTIDEINVLNEVSNLLPAGVNIDLTTAKAVNTVAPTMGLMAQDVITFNKYIKAHLGVRYSRLIGF
jgi:iron complex outermembrane receptor protein